MNTEYFEIYNFNSINYDNKNINENFGMVGTVSKVVGNAASKVGTIIVKNPQTSLLIGGTAALGIAGSVLYKPKEKSDKPNETVGPGMTSFKNEDVLILDENIPESQTEVSNIIIGVNTISTMAPGNKMIAIAKPSITPSNSEIVVNTPIIPSNSETNTKKTGINFTYIWYILAVLIFLLIAWNIYKWFTKPKLSNIG